MADESVQKTDKPRMTLEQERRIMRNTINAYIDTLRFSVPPKKKEKAPDLYEEEHSI